MRPLNITFLLPFAGITGGIRAVVEIANRLQDSGHTVRLVWPEISICSRRNRLLRNVPGARRFLRRNSGTLSWATPRVVTEEVEQLTPQHVAPADVIVATAWQTAECLMRFPSSHGVPLYFLQHYEVWSGPPNLVDRTWKAGFHCAVTAPWLADLARDRFGIEDVDHVPYGVDSELFRPDPEGQSQKGSGLRVGLLCHEAAWKGTADGLEAIRLARKRNVDARPVLFGTSRPDKKWPDPGVEIEMHLDPPQEALRRLYSSMDVFLCSSHTETGPLTVLEAMACEVPVVSTEVGNVKLWTSDGRFALLAPPARPDTLARHLERIAREPAFAASMARRCREQATRFTWDATARGMEDALRHALTKAGRPE